LKKTIPFSVETEHCNVGTNPERLSTDLDKSGPIPEDDSGTAMKVWIEKFRTGEAGVIIFFNIAKSENAVAQERKKKHACSADGTNLLWYPLTSLRTIV
jgi:hypothetical protein